MFPYVPQGKQTVLDVPSFLIFLGLELSASLLILTVLSLLPSVCCFCVKMLIWSSSSASKLFSSNSLSRWITICSYVPFSKWAWFQCLQVWRHVGIYELFNDCLAATPNASFANFWSSSDYSINFWFAGFKTRIWNLCFAVAFDWCFTYFLQNTDKNSSKFSFLGLVMFSNVCSASPRMREWK